MSTNLHDKMLAAIDAYFSASNEIEAHIAEEQLLDVRAAINKHRLAVESLNEGLPLDDWDKIGCVNHDCDKCKAQQAPDETLLSFYQATDFPSLVSAMEGHIKKMQSKLQSNPHTAIDAWNNRELVGVYCKAWEQSFTADNPYHTVSMTAEDRKHIKAGLKAALAEQPAQDNTYGYAKGLAESLFKKHYAHEEHYASGRIVWEVSDTTIGLLTQIDNMVCTLVRPAEQPAQQEPVAYGMWDTMLGKGNRMMMVRLDKGQDGCTVPLYTSPSNLPGYQAMAMAVTRLQKRCSDLEGKQPAQQDIPDLIAGALGVSRGTAYDMMREALAEQPLGEATLAQQKPVVCKHEWFSTGAMETGQCRCIKCGAWNTTLPAQRTWVGLTDEDVMSIAFNFDVSSLSLVARAIEAKLKEKNT